MEVIALLPAPILPVFRAPSGGLLAIGEWPACCPYPPCPYPPYPTLPLFRAPSGGLLAGGEWPACCPYPASPYPPPVPRPLRSPSGWWRMACVLLHPCLPLPSLPYPPPVPRPLRWPGWWRMACVLPLPCLPLPSPCSAPPQVAFWLVENGLRVLIAACDTFRAGAVEQLRTHVRRLNALHPAPSGEPKVQLYEQGYGKDAAAIAMQAINFGERRLPSLHR